MILNCFYTLKNVCRVGFFFPLIYPPLHHTWTLSVCHWTAFTRNRISEQDNMLKFNQTLEVYNVFYVSLFKTRLKTYALENTNWKYCSIDSRMFEIYW